MLLVVVVVVAGVVVVVFKGLRLTAGRRPSNDVWLMVCSCSCSCRSRSSSSSSNISSSSFPLARSLCAAGAGGFRGKMIGGAIHDCPRNRLKHRKWYRPCAPIVAREDLELLFEPGPDLAYGIPYMSFAPPLQKWVKKWLPGITHLDGTARPQTVDREDDP